MADTPPTPTEALLHSTIVKVLSEHRLHNMADEDGEHYPLVDALTPDGDTLATGEQEIALLADEIWHEVRAALSPTIGADDEALLRACDDALAAGDSDAAEAAREALRRHIAGLRDKYEIADWCNDQSLRLYHAERKRAEAAERELAACKAAGSGRSPIPDDYDSDNE